MGLDGESGEEGCKSGSGCVTKNNVENEYGGCGNASDSAKSCVDSDDGGCGNANDCVTKIDVEGFGKENGVDHEKSVTSNVAFQNYVDCVDFEDYGKGKVLNCENQNDVEDCAKENNVEGWDKEVEDWENRTLAF